MTDELWKSKKFSIPILISTKMMRGKHGSTLQLGLSVRIEARLTEQHG
jgi:hypothetical protein